MNKKNIVFFGTPQFGAYILEKLIVSKKFTIIAIVTSPDKPVGRKQTLTPSPVSQLAQKYDIPVLKPVKLDSDFLTTNYLPVRQAGQLLTTDLPRSGKLDLFVVASYGKIIPQSLLDIPRFGSINIHCSILPKYRGASPIQTAILNGDKETGVTIMLMDEKMDHGPILATQKIPINQADTFEGLSTKLAEVGIKLLMKTIPQYIRGNIKPLLQRHAIATYCNLIKKEDGYFDLPAGRQVSIRFLKKLDRLIRAYYPWPTAWTRWNGKIVKLLPNQMIQIEGKKPIPLKDFLNGYPDFPVKF